MVCWPAVAKVTLTVAMPFLKVTVAGVVAVAAVTVEPADENTAPASLLVRPTVPS